MKKIVSDMQRACSLRGSYMLPVYNRVTNEWCIEDSETGELRVVSNQAYEDMRTKRMKND